MGHANCVPFLFRANATKPRHRQRQASCATAKNAGISFGRKSLAENSCWFRDLDSNQDSQLQRLMCYRLHYPGTAVNSLADAHRPATLYASSWNYMQLHVRCVDREFLLN